MRPFEIPEERRAVYHAAASIASNFLVALEESAADLLADAGAPDARELLAPLVLRTAANWSERGAAALTGPIARGDEATVTRHLEALRETAPELVPLYETLAARTRALRRGGIAMKVVRAKAQLRAEVAAARAAGTLDRHGPDDGRPARRPPRTARRGTRALRPGRHVLFVNPAQFRPGEDLDAYPRSEDRDIALAEAAGGRTGLRARRRGGLSGRVRDQGRGRRRADPRPRRRPGPPRPEHFDGVTTVVAKLFNSVDPDLAFFGQKDAQQAVVVKRMTRDLDFPVEIIVVRRCREDDGLAMSSRNAYLGDEDRSRAAALSRALRAAEAAVAAGEESVDAVLAAARAELDAAGIEPEYWRHATPRTGVGAELQRATIVFALAARVGPARADRQRGDRARLNRERNQMQRQKMLKSKIHRATVTGCDVGLRRLDHPRSGADGPGRLLVNEQVHVWDIDNGSRFVTYAIEGEPGSGAVRVNGAAARLVNEGDKVIVASFASYDERDLETYDPVVVHVNADNRIARVDSHPEVLLDSELASEASL